jgi:hypothetical protein
MAYGNYTQVLHVFCRELRQDRLVFSVLAKRGLVLLKAKAPQPACDIHDSAALLRLPGIMVLPRGGV